MTNSYYTLIPKEEMTNFIRLNKKMNYFIVKELLCLVCDSLVFLRVVKFLQKFVEFITKELITYSSLPIIWIERTTENRK